MEDTIYYPIQRLNKNITDFLKKIVSSDIIGAIESGLENEINLIDIGEHMTDIASIGKNPLTGQSEVRLSAAYCQYYWFISDIALKISDRNVIEESCKEYGVSLDEFKIVSEMIINMPKDLLNMNMSKYPEVDTDSLVSYFHCVPEILETNFWEEMEIEYKHALSLIDKDMHIDIDEIQSYDVNAKYHERVNSLYCYGIAFILLHELSHHSLGHVGQPDKDGDEESADMSAFWSIFTDVIGEHRISANASILFVFFSFMELDPSLKEDGVHPRDDKRLFAVYDLIKDEYHKYTEILVRLLNFWSKMNNKVDYPANLPCTEESVIKIKQYFDSLDSCVTKG